MDAETIPVDVALALDTRQLRSASDAMTRPHTPGYLNRIDVAKRDETRARRIARMVERLAGAEDE